MDEIERQYEQAIHAALREGDNDEAYWLQCGLDEYRRWYKA